MRRLGRESPRRGVAPIVIAVICLALAGAVPAGGSAAPAVGGWTWDLPAGSPTPRVPASNPMTRPKVALGRHLFYDTRLSGNGRQSCGICHQQDRAFTDGPARSIGSTGEIHPRSALSLANVAYNATLTWANPSLVTPEKQMEAPLFGERPIEMGLNDRNMAAVLRRLERSHCHTSFNFDDQTVHADTRVVDTPFHNTGLFNIGGAGAFPQPNRGVFELTGDVDDMGAFRAPTLRNVAVTAPYMYDGSIATLKAVVRFYADGGRNITSGPDAGDGRLNPHRSTLI